MKQTQKDLQQLRTEQRAQQQRVKALKAERAALKSAKKRKSSPARLSKQGRK